MMTVAVRDAVQSARVLPVEAIADPLTPAPVITGSIWERMMTRGYRATATVRLWSG